MSWNNIKIVRVEQWRGRGHRFILRFDNGFSGHRAAEPFSLGNVLFFKPMPNRLVHWYLTQRTWTLPEYQEWLLNCRPQDRTLIAFIARLQEHQHGTARS